MKVKDADLDLTIAHADAPTLVRNFEARQPGAQAEIFLCLAVSVDAEQQKIFIDAGQALADQGAETILLGGRDLFLAFDGETVPFETLDCAGVHINAIARAASQA